MPLGGPKPKQFSQAGANQNDVIAVSPVGSDETRASPVYGGIPRDILLGPGIFSDLSDPFIRGDTEYPDFDGDFEAYDVLESSADDKSLSIAYEGRLSENEIVQEISINIKGDNAQSPTTTPQFRLSIYVEGAGTSNPTFNSGFMDAESSMNEYVVLSSQITEQPTGQGKYFVIIDVTLDANQNVKCSRPWSRHA